MSRQNSAARSDISQIQAGSGRIVLASHHNETVFTELSSTYPLKLLSPSNDAVAVVYMLTYGGGLVGGDRVNLEVDVGAFATLVLLSQGSTKVFKTRPGERISSLHNNTVSSEPIDSRLMTQQTMNSTLGPHSALFLLPDPVTCFRSASYNQIQTFRLSEHASLVLLDWITPGRQSLGEEWVFSRYYSVNEIWVNGKRIARDAMLLEDQHLETALPRHSLRDRLAPYSCYATLLLWGPLVTDTLTSLTAAYQTISVFKTSRPSDLIWSLSPIVAHGGKGGILRLAATETEIVKRWLRDNLSVLEAIVGVDVYRRAFDC